MDAKQHKQHIQEIFDAVSGQYDSSATRFFPFCADQLVEFVKPASGSKVLDVATGTGMVATAMAQAVGESGRVTGIDLSTGMLDKAQINIHKMALKNIDLHEMDAEKLDFKSGYFHSVVCSYGLFFIPDMEAALKDWVRVVSPGGKVAFTCFETTAFQPMLDDFVNQLKQFGVVLPEGPFGSKRIESTEHCHSLLTGAGLQDTTVVNKQLGYHLRDEQEWWEVVNNTAMRGLYLQVPEADRARFRESHLQSTRKMLTGKGLWMDVETRFAMGSRPNQ
jgi:ubiquinone/menaquinone biosynthesis C-methylase UbiE